MRNLLIFITKYSAFFLFLIFEVISLVIFINYNGFQKASFINTSNEVVGNLYNRVNDFYDYLSLKQINDNLAQENAKLRSQLRASYYIDSVSKHSVNDTVYKQQYSYIDARVINNSTNKRLNYLTLNKGAKEGIAKGMGVICATGVVGVVVKTSDHFATVRSLLHKDSRISAMLASSREGGTFTWNDDLNPFMGILSEVSNNAQPHLGDWVVTSQYSLFPMGIHLGRVSNLHAKAGGFFLNMEVRMAVDFSKLEYVYVVDNKLAQEQIGLEAQQKQEKDE
ncbi:rod shape-determining protein MreC [Mucilaginibacter gynuensis]|uniref:Cell shape-determining protein MreC n=1 Tax=Mucilaginibacter gynuensis TaxID=1302236 RepID=A0ABP8HIZ9_9SPHI